MMGEDRDTKPAAAKAADLTEASPISSGDFPSVAPQRIDTHSTANLRVVPPPVPVSNLPARRKIGKYSLIKEIGRGGMGVVYHAHQEDLNRDVALKVIPSGPDADKTEVARFQAEAETAANLHHPNIVPVYDVGSADGLSYLAMELIEGGSLFKLINHEPIDPILAARLLEAVARAMHYAHTQGVIHRDLKPSNILLAHPEAGSHRSDRTPDEDLIPKITDFGLAKRLDRPLALTQTGLAVGTPHYMAPEQALGKSDLINALTDVYALGAILYEMLTGHPPFGASSSLETMQQVVSRKPLPPSSLRASVPRELEQICLKCLEKKPANRFESALAVAEALHHFLHRTEPPTILARTPMEPESSVSLLVRQSENWYFWPVVALLMCVLTGVITWRISDMALVRSQNSLSDSNYQRQRETAYLQAEKAFLLADRGDFEGVASLELNSNSSLESVIAQYRNQQLLELKWDLPKADYIGFVHKSSVLGSLGENQLSYIDIANGQLIGEANSAKAFGNSKRDGSVAFIDEQDRLHAKFPGEVEYRMVTLGSLGQVRIVQPFASEKTVGLSDGVSRWIVQFTNKPTDAPTLLPKEPEPANVLTVSEQGDWLLKGASNWRVIHAKNTPAREIPSPGLKAKAVFSPTGSHLLAILPNGSAKLFDFNDDRWVDMPADGYVSTASFSSDGNVLVMGTGAGTVRLWDVHSRTRLSGSANLKSRILSTDIDHLQTHVAAVIEGGKSFGFSNPARPFVGPAIRLANKPDRDIVDIAFSGDNKSLYVTTLRGLSRWNYLTGKRDTFKTGEELTPTQLLPSSQLTSPESGYKSMSVNPSKSEQEADQVLVGSADGKLAVVALKQDGMIVPKESSIPNGKSVTGIAHSPDGNRTVAVGDISDKSSFLHYWSSNEGLQTNNNVTKPLDFKITTECFDSSNRKIYLGCEDGGVYVWNSEDTATNPVRKFECESRVIHIALDGESKHLLVGCADGNALVFEIETGKRTRTLKHRTEVRKVAFHRDRPITAAADGAIRVWHPSIDFTLGSPFRHADAITALSIRGNFLAAGSRDRTIRVWQLPK